MEQRPNILVIMTDQQRFGMLSSDGDRFVRTDALDRLAAEARSFNLTYCANPVCVPSRYSMLSGRMPHEFEGIETNYKQDPGRQPSMAACVENAQPGSVFREAGYDAFYGGKLHVEQHNAYVPEAEPTFGFSCLTSDSRAELAEKSADFITNRKEAKPFLLWLCFINPHDICMALDRQTGRPVLKDRNNAGLPTLPDNFAPTIDEAEWMSRFRNGTLGDEEEFEIGLNRIFGQLAASWTERDWRVYRAVYRHHMTAVDRHIGRVLDALDQSGLGENTVVIFTSDHGDHDAEHRLTMKRSFYEAAVHVPLMIRCPGMAGAGTADDSHLINNGIDLVPTLYDFAGITISRELRGGSLKALAEGVSADGWRDYTVSETIGGRMLRTREYKYVVYHHSHSEEMLFDMKSDPGETKNLSGVEEHRTALERHREQLRSWTVENGDEKGKLYMADV